MNKHLIKKYFITGLLIWVPLGITFWILHLLLGTLDETLLVLPKSLRPDNLFGFDIPGLGVVLTVAVVFLTGVFATNLFGRSLVKIGETLLTRIPVVKTIYTSVKQVSDTLLSGSGEAFRKALLIEYPRSGVYTIAFLTGQPASVVKSHLESDYVSVYVPTTPNPTSGFFLMLPRNEVIELDMSVDEALKYIISMGVVAPGHLPPQSGEPKP